MTKSTRRALAPGAGLLTLALADPAAAQVAPTTLGDFDGDGHTDRKRASRTERGRNPSRRQPPEEGR